MFQIALILSFILAFLKIAIPAAVPWLTWGIVFLPLGIAAAWFVLVLVVVFILSVLGYATGLID